MTITKDYGNSCLNNCILHLFQHKTVAFQDSTIIFLPFPARFSFTQVSHVGKLREVRGKLEGS